MCFNIDQLVTFPCLYYIRNLEESTRSVYKENVRITEVLAYHVAETEQLKKLRDNLMEENQSLKSEKHLNELAMQKSVQQTKQMKSTIKQVRIFLVCHKILWFSSLNFVLVRNQHDRNFLRLFFIKWP